MSLGLTSAQVLNLARPVAREAGMRLAEVIWETSAEFVAAVLLDLHKFSASADYEPWGAELSEARLERMREAGKELAKVTPEQIAAIKAIHTATRAELHEKFSPCRPTKISAPN